MIVIRGNIWDLVLTNPVDAVVITTNGYVRKDGAAVMGAGIAFQAKQQFERIEYKLGELIQKYGNHVAVICEPYVYENQPYALVSFPVKHVWWEKADLDLIARSAKELVDLTNQRNWNMLLVPMPGCGNGGRKWEEVEPILQPLFDHRFIITTLESEGI